MTRERYIDISVYVYRCTPVNTEPSICVLVSAAIYLCIYLYLLYTYVYANIHNLYLYIYRRAQREAQRGFLPDLLEPCYVVLQLYTLG